MSDQITIGIVAPSSRLPQVELKLGVDHLTQSGFKVRVHPQCKKTHLFFAGTDQERANGIYEFAMSSEIDVLWCGRGGHGAIRLLSILRELSKGKKAKPRKKLLVGYSDITALMEFVSHEWGWSTLHASMPTFRKFTLLDPHEWETLLAWIRKEPAPLPWKRKLEWWNAPPSKPIRGPMVGGNLTVWNCLLGTPFQGKLDGKILFLEDIEEAHYRIDRMVQQLALTGSLDRVKAIVLGNFMGCRDMAPKVLKAYPKPSERHRILTAPQPQELKLLRPLMKEKAGLKRVFQELGRDRKIPILFGLPVGHGPEVAPLPLGAQYQITPRGELDMISWDWLKTK